MQNKRNCAGSQWARETVMDNEDLNTYSNIQKGIEKNN